MAPDRRAVATQLAAAGVASPDWDARILIEHAMSVGADLDDLVARRVAREPLQHIIGSVGFRHLDLYVGPGVFVPRPETELLVDAVIAAVEGQETVVIVDFCAGSGAIGLSAGSELSRKGVSVEVHLIESSAEAAAWLRRNVDSVLASGSTAQFHVHEKDLNQWPRDLAGSVDAVATNPPYLPAGTVLDAETARFDPALALWGGEDGLDVIRRLIPEAAALLRPGGTLAIEHDVSHDLAPMMLQGWQKVLRHNDLTHRPRFTTAVKA